MGNVHMEAKDINYRGGNKKMSVEEALKNTSGEAAAIAQLQTDVTNLRDVKANQITIAPTFSTETAYDPGDLVYYNGLSYRCVNAHEGEWDADDFAATTISNELASLMSGLTNVSGLLSNIKNLGVYTGDLNDIDETCFCFVGASASHAPVEHTNTHQLLTIISEPAYNGWMNTRVKIQIYMINSSSAKPYIRYFYGSGWYEWSSNN